MAEKKDEIPSNEENSDQNSPAHKNIKPTENQNGQRPRGESLIIFSYHDLEKATSNFDSILGKGAYGTVYEGKLVQTREIVAVKKLLGADSKQGGFLKEVFMLSILRHPNIINLIGFSAQRPNQPLLVYEFMPERSLDYHLFDLKPKSKLLDWKTRMKIALGSAKALDYLHNEAIIFHDLRSANILLDESFRPKLSDFGLAEFDPTPPPNSGFSKEEYYVFWTKIDVRDFGIVLFELITGRSKAVIQVEHGQEPFDWLNPKRSKLDEAVDPRLKGKVEMTSLEKAVDVALACLHKTRRIRSHMRDVVRALEDIVDDLDKTHSCNSIVLASSV